MTLPVRLGLYYSALFVGVGASSPYFPVWLAHRGLSGAEIGVLLSLPMLVRVVSAPLLAVWADSFKLRRTALIWMGAGVAALYALLALPFGFAWWMVVWFAASSMASTLPALTDVIVLRRAASDGFNYGWPRGLGSVAFIVANVGVGWLLARGSPEIVLVWMVAASAIAALSARLLLPADQVHDDHPASLQDRLAGLEDLIRDPAFMTAVVSAGLIQSSHAFYYSFSTLTWKQQGVPESLTGVLWGFAVLIEIGFLWFLEPWRRAMGPIRLLLLGAGAALVRWTILAFAPPLWLVLPLQALHAFTYAATFVASLELVQRYAPPRHASAAQAMNSALSTGVLSGLATIASGWLFDRYGAGGYILMSGLSALGFVGALRLAAGSRLRSPA